MDDKVKDGGFDDEGQIFPETETRRLAERYAPKNSTANVERPPPEPELERWKAAQRSTTSVPASVLTPRTVEVEGVRAIEQALRRPPAPEPRHALLTAREHTHGNFEATALIAQRFKDVARNTPNWGSKLTDVQREALEGVFIKVARILSGNPDHKDHWSDIAGYAHLVEERL